MASEEPNVLIVEDESDLARLFEIWLTDDFSVRSVFTGSEAVAALEEGLHVLVLDWHLPDRRGGAILREIDEAGIDVGVAVVTGSEPNVDGLEDRVGVVLRKPVSKAELLDAVHRLAPG